MASPPSLVDKGNRVTGLACSADNQCYLVDNAGNVVVFNGTTWSTPSAVDAGHVLSAISCAPSEFSLPGECVAVDSAGDEVTFTGQVVPAVVSQQIPFSAVVINVTVTDGSASGYLTIWNAAMPEPSTSMINWAPGETIANSTIVSVDAQNQWGYIDVKNGSSAPVDVVIDVVGEFVP